MLSVLSFSLLALSASCATAFSTPRADSIASSTNSNGSLEFEMVAAAWYVGWHADDFTLANVSWDKYTLMTYSFAEITSDGNLTLNGSDPSLLSQFVSTAHENDVKALTSIGGWNGGLYFSSALATDANRSAFVDVVTSFVQAYDLDGVDFDWEYPGYQGVGCNIVSVNDTANFLSFLQELRANPVMSNLTITASATIKPWVGADGQPSTNVSAFADVLDWVNLMVYDVWGSWSNAVGPNAPLNDTCASSADQQGSAVSALAAWTEAGMPPHQLVLGVASYGHSFNVSDYDAFYCDDDSLAPYPSFQSPQPLGDAWDALTNTDVCGNTSGPAGTFDYWGLIDGGFLYPNGSVMEGVAYRFDECSQTPYVYNTTSLVMVSYDNAQSFYAKGQFINQTNMRGFQMWEAGGDYNDTLLDAISQGAGLLDADDDC